MGEMFDLGTHDTESEGVVGTLHSTQARRKYKENGFLRFCTNVLLL